MYVTREALADAPTDGLEMRLRDLLDAETSWAGALSMLHREGGGQETEYEP